MERFRDVDVHRFAKGGTKMKRMGMAILIGMFSVGAFARQGGPVSPGGFGSPGGFKGPTPGLTTVAQARSLPDDAWVVLEGHIVKQIGHELYEFRDKSGTIRLDLDDKRWMGQTVAPTDKVHIEGEVDKDWNSVEIDVKTLRLMQ
ncbi:YgiW/YdeI family stress tolerance OB fold protein [Burkholderia perseverans]|uniref:YgiW/YdeI family stress tolerance OB fold protein n=1 Tax=Burkholderia perseverans TaxID=2615214 RepID=UPI002467B50F|nr:YgiW/YdeI family stress tolerance OB fold protein [Burkholderia perseverans]